MLKFVSNKLDPTEEVKRQCEGVQLKNVRCAPELYESVVKTIRKLQSTGRLTHAERKKINTYATCYCKGDYTNFVSAFSNLIDIGYYGDTGRGNVSNSVDKLNQTLQKWDQLRMDTQPQMTAPTALGNILKAFNGTRGNKGTSVIAVIETHLITSLSVSNTSNFGPYFTQLMQYVRQMVNQEDPNKAYLDMVQFLRTESMKVGLTFEQSLDEVMCAMTKAFDMSSSERISEVPELIF